MRVPVAQVERIGLGKDFSFQHGKLRFEASGHTGHSSLGPLQTTITSSLARTCRIARQSLRDDRSFVMRGDHHCSHTDPSAQP